MDGAYRDLIPPPSRIVVGLSGGVDSAVAALLLLRAGYQVEGLFMKNWEDDDTLTHCAAAEDLAAAQEVARRLSIPLHQINFAARYRDEVFSYCLDELRAGRTPNPDILCNRHIKFDAFLGHALDHLGAAAVATGHYARLRRISDRPPRLLRGLDRDKDQSYFLHGVPAAAFHRTLFPLGGLTKDRVRAEARDAGLPNHDRPDSTGICFIGERNFGEFIGRYIPDAPGPIVTDTGDVIGHHRGLHHYTVGQRRGLGIGGSHAGDGPWYVARKDAEDHALVVVEGHDHPLLLAQVLETGPPHWLGPAPSPGAHLTAQIRYRQLPQPCSVVYDDDGGLTVLFESPQRAPAAGQYVVLYHGDTCLGGAPIRRHLPLEASSRRVCGTLAG